MIKNSQKIVVYDEKKHQKVYVEVMKYPVYVDSWMVSAVSWGVWEQKTAYRKFTYFHAKSSPVALC